MTNTKYIITTFIGRQKRYLFGSGKTAGNQLVVEYSTQKVDAEVFDTETEAETFKGNIANPFSRLFTIEPIAVVDPSFDASMATFAHSINKQKPDKMAAIKKVKSLKTTIKLR